MILKCCSWWLLVCSRSVIQDVSVLQNTVIHICSSKDEVICTLTSHEKLAFRAVRTYVAKERLNCCKRQKIEKLQRLWLVGNQHFLRVYTLFACLSLCVFTLIYVSVARLQLPSICYVPAGPKSKMCCPLGDASYAWLRLCFLAHTYNCNLLICILICAKLQAKEPRREMKLVPRRLLKELGQVCSAFFCCVEAWQRWWDQIKPIIDIMLFSKCFCFWWC